MLLKSFYDPEKSYEENFEQGPFGAFANKEMEFFRYDIVPNNVAETIIAARK